MGVMAHSLIWVMQDSYHQPYERQEPPVSSRGSVELFEGLGCLRV